MPYVIYRVTNTLNGKCYIGITNNPPRRFRQHKTGLGSLALKRAIKKYGLASFSFEEVACAINEQDASVVEIQLISEHNSYRFGYNNTKGGEGRSGHVGEDCHLSILTESQVRALIHDPCSHLEAARKYRVNYVTLHNVRSGKSWPHISRKNAPRYQNDRVVVSRNIAQDIIHDSISHAGASEKYGIAVANVRAVRYGKSWKNLDRSQAPEYHRASRWV